MSSTAASASIRVNSAVRDAASRRVVLRIALGQHAHVQPLKTGAVTSDRIAFDFVEYDPLPSAFRTMVRGGDIDVAEMAITTHLLALEFGKPLTALAIPLWRRLHHGNLVCLADAGLRGPEDLAGARIGVRAYSQTTGVWIRGILASHYGLALDRITWVTMEDAHVAEFRDPPNAVRAPGGCSLRDLMMAGEVSSIMGERNVDPAGVRAVIPDSEAAAEQWSARTGVFPVNHILSVRTELLDQHPWLSGELTRVLEQSRQQSGAHGAAALPYGVEPNRKSLQTLCDFAAAQGLTSRTYTVDKVFPPAHQAG